MRYRKEIKDVCPQAIEIVVNINIIFIYSAATASLTILATLMGERPHLHQSRDEFQPRVSPS